MSTNTIASDIIAEHDAKQRKQPLPTPKEVHARMIEMTNAANGLRYEVARFGDIERQLKAVHEKMEPLVLKAKELNDLICERVSQASQPWADSRIHESEELLQKVQQLERENAALRADVLEQCMVNAKGGEREYSLRGRIEQLERENAALRAADQIDISALRRENAALRSLIDDPNAMHSHYLRECNGWEVWQAERIRRFQDASEQLEQLQRENAALRRDVYQCPPTSENGYEGLKWADAFEVIERDNAELHNKLVALQHQSQWQCSCGGTDCEGQKENAELRGDLEEALFERDEVKRVRYSLEDALTRSQAEAESCWGKKERLADAAEGVFRAYINVVRVTGHPCPENLVICRELRAAIDAARKEDKP